MNPKTTNTAKAIAVLALVLGTAAAGCASTDGTGDQSAQQASGSATRTTPTGARLSGPADGATPTAGGSVVMDIEAEPEGLDPTRYAFAGSGHFVASAVYDPLATLDEEGQSAPYLAEAIEPNDDNTVWTITVRDGVTFHDGSPVDAAAIVTNLEAQRNSVITGAALQTVTDISSPDPDHVVVTLELPWAAFPSVLTSQLGYVAEPKALAAGTLAASPVGSGPFVFDKHDPNQLWRFKRYDDYWRTGADGATLPYLAEISFKPVPDDAMRLQQLEDGDADIINTFRPTEVLALRDSDYKTVEYDLGEEEHLLLNTAAPPFDNLDARLAVAYATDSDRWIDEMNQGIGGHANSPFAPGQLGYLEDNGYPSFDMAKAKEHVAAYEQATGQPLAFSYLTVDDPTNLRNHQFFAGLYEEAGMQVTVQGLPQINLIAQTATGNYQLSAFRNFGFPDPDTDAVFLQPASIREEGVSLNFPRFDDPALQEAIDRARAATSDVDRDAAYKDVSRILGENVPYIWLARADWFLAANPRVNGIYAAANGSIQTLGPKTWIAELWVS